MKRQKNNRPDTIPAISAEQLEFLDGVRRRRRTIRIWQWLIFVLLIALWEVTAQLGILDAFIFSCPSRIVKCIFTMSSDGTLFFHLGITLAETLASFLLITGIGLLAAILLWWNSTLSKICEPYLVVLNSLPKSALAPVFIVWLGSNMKTIIVAAISVALFGTILTLLNDFCSVEDDKVKLIETLGGKKRDVLFKVIIPGNVPSIVSLMKVNIGLALVGVIIAEFIAAKAGLGYLIIYGSQVFKLDYVMMSIVLLCIVATGLYQLLNLIEKRYQH